MKTQMINALITETAKVVNVPWTTEVGGFVVETSVTSDAA